MNVPLLDIRGLHLDYNGKDGPAHALRGIDLTADAGEVIGIVGESGCGKSSLALAMTALLPRNAKVTSGEVRLSGQDILSMDASSQRAMRGSGVSMIFQDPMTAFNPVLTLGKQLVDFQRGTGLSRAERRTRAEEMLERVSLADPVAIMGRFVHEISGGMRQRIGIAAAMLNHPKVLIADEPTTALDVTVEAQIIHLLRGLRQDHHGAIVVITHHLGVVGELCDRVYVMYAGQVVETAPIDTLYHAAKHPYTQALIACDPANLTQKTRVLPTIAGRLPDMRAPPKGCSFADRCPIAQPVCMQVAPPRVDLTSDHSALCHMVQP